MTQIGQQYRAGLICLTLSIFCLSNSSLRAAGVLYADPGWNHALEGDQAYYHDPDGPNPDYINGTPANQPGGQTNSPALINPGSCAPNCDEVAIWQVSGSQWDGSAPGAPNGSPLGTPPVIPPAPGGVATYTAAGTSYLRIQDAGNPQSYGFADKNEQASATSPRQEGNNRRIQFKHQMSRDPGFSDRQDIIDFGVTVAFRARIATPATGPLDRIFPEGGSSLGNTMDWPADGIGYPIGNNGRSLVMLTQTGSAGPGQLSFSLVNTNTLTANGITSVTRTGLVMNNRASGPGGGSVDTGDATAATLNMVDIPDAQLTDWHEFWITISKLPSPLDNNTHEVKVYMDGSLTPTTFQTILGLQNEFGTGSHLGLSMSSGTRAGAIDLDYLAYKEGIFVPTLVPTGIAGDYNGNNVVDAADYVLWRNGGPLQNDATPGVQPEDYGVWKANFGKTPGSGSLIGTVPEPSALFLILVGALLVGPRRSKR